MSIELADVTEASTFAMVGLNDSSKSSSDCAYTPGCTIDLRRRRRKEDTQAFEAIPGPGKELLAKYVANFHQSDANDVNMIWTP
jgi:hypothetical protein